MKTAVATPDPDNRPCDHKLHGGGHRASFMLGRCHCGIPGCTICPDVRQELALMIPSQPPGNTMGRVREFESGATRDTLEGKLNFEAFLNPKVLLRYAEYMHEHRKRSDGTMREGDDWQKGMPSDVYMESLMRHVFDVWLLHRGYKGEATQDISVALCGTLFNAMGYLFNYLEGKE